MVPSLDRLEERRLLTSTVFARSFGESSVGTVTVEAEAVDASGDIFVTGSFSGTVSFGSTMLTSQAARNIFVAELNPAGNVVWAKRMGSTSRSDNDFGRGIALDPNGNVLVTGFYGATSQFGGVTLNNSGQRDIFVEKLDGSGNVLWAKGFGGTGDDLGQSVAVDRSGNVYVTGSYQNSVAFGGVTLNAADASSTDVFVTKLSTDSGVVVWATSLAGQGQSSGYGIALDGNTNVYVTGDFTGSGAFGSTILTSAGDSDIFVTKLNSSGTVGWAVREGGLGHDDATAIASDSSGNLFVTGDFVGPVTFGSSHFMSAGQDDSFLERLDSSGNVVWARQFGGSGYDAAYGIALDSAGNVYTTGVFQGTASFGSQSLTSNGFNDVYMTKSDSLGNLTLALNFGSTADEQAYQVAVGSTTPKITLVGSYGGTFNVRNDGLPATGSGYVIQLSQATPAGGSEALSNFDSVGDSQLAIYRRSTQSWYAIGPTKGHLLGAFGGIGDIPVAGDYDSLGHSELAVYRPSTSQWFAQSPSGTHVVAVFGGVGDIPVPGDYDHVGHTQAAVYRPSTGQWFVLSSNGFGHVAGVFGSPSDIPVPGDYLGLGKTQLAVYRPSTAQWFVLGPTGFGQVFATFGGTGDVPVPGDYDAIGHAQVAVFRPSTAQWFVLGTTGSHMINTFGAIGLADVPTEAAFLSLQQLGYFGGGSGSSFSRSRGGGGLHMASLSVPSSMREGVGSTSVVRAVTPTPTSPVVRGVVPSAILKKDDVWRRAIEEMFGRP